MKKYYVFLLIIMLLFNQKVFADDCASKTELAKKIDAEYYCYYNSSGIPDDTYNVIVGISKDKKSVYADTGACDDNFLGTGLQPIWNWSKDASKWDSDLDESYSAKRYYEENNKCPEIAYLHYYPFTYALYLINSNQLESLLETFSYTMAKDNEDKYYLIDFDSDTNVKMTCSYETKMKENSASTEKNHNVKFDLNFNADGKIINANNLSDRVYLAPEISLNYKYVNNVCPQLYICHVNGKVSTVGHTSVYEYKYELYFSDYETLYSRKDCHAILCNNNDDDQCEISSENSKICPSFENLYQVVKDNYFLSSNDKSNISKAKTYNDSKQKLVSYCSGILSNLNADNPCIQKCLGLKNALIELEEINIERNECGLSSRLFAWLSNILKWIKYILPVIVIVLGILDFMKAIGSDKEDEIKKMQKNFVRRLIAAALVFIIPLIIEFILNKMGFSYNSCDLFK